MKLASLDDKNIYNIVLHMILVFI